MKKKLKKSNLWGKKLSNSLLLRIPVQIYIAIWYKKRTRILGHADRED